MIAAVEAQTKLCVVLHTARRGLKAIATTYCNVEHDASKGVVQVHEKFFREDMKWLSVVDKRSLVACPVCKSVSGLGGR